MEPLTHEQVLAIIGDQTLELRQLGAYAGRLAARVEELELELARQAAPVESAE